MIPTEEEMEKENGYVHVKEYTGEEFESFINNNDPKKLSYWEAFKQFLKNIGNAWRKRNE